MFDTSACTGIAIPAQAFFWLILLQEKKLLKTAIRK